MSDVLGAKERLGRDWQILVSLAETPELPLGSCPFASCSFGSFCHGGSGSSLPARQEELGEARARPLSLPACGLSSSTVEGEGGA